ncbi:hypothetical protein BO224_00435 [Erysipelotrichaceae bacterium NYU-BL-E8]|uniref:Uncharacterized protein n=1 Tax=Ileibacterium valens TaxID=1862668 RepID=A0A1U7NE58_9FIRM|nr:hypothetical protein BO222_09920 [Ileibacterium valens]OLU42044.1 hypothetical protein BM735_03145 [Erysipelotrichaceae bacterium NYU-BL-F16]OLU43273.1 hypothetical protein BO224_00435 [Erysipelotrichaceae bacterium NYU-BL-E8]
MPDDEFILKALYICPNENESYLPFRSIRIDPIRTIRKPKILMHIHEQYDVNLVPSDLKSKYDQVLLLKTTKKAENQSGFLPKGKI